MSFMHRHAKQAQIKAAWLKVGVLTVGIVGAHWLLRNSSLRQAAARLPWWLFGAGWAALLVALVLTQKSSSSFIYFKF